MASTLLHIGGDALQLAAIRWAHEAGLEVVVADADPQAPGRHLGDRFASLAAHDVRGLTSLALAIHAEGELVGAYCSNDHGLEAVAAVGEATGTPANAPAAVRNALDRVRAREAWHAHGVPSTAGRIVDSVDDLHAALDELGLPAIVEPVDARGARGPRTVRDEPEAGEAFAEARRRGCEVFVERWVAGRRVGVNAYFRDRAYIPCGIHERFLSPAPHRVAARGMLPSSLERSERRAVHALVERAARALEITVGPVKADVVWADEGPLVLELAPRFHDDVASVVTAPLVYGKSPIQAWYASLTDAGGPFDAMPTEPRANGGWLSITAGETGVLRGVTGIEHAKAATGIEDVTILRRPGHMIRDVGDQSATIGYLWARGWDGAEVEERLRVARERIEVEVEWLAVA